MRPALCSGWVVASILTLCAWPGVVSGDAHRDALARVQDLVEDHLGARSIDDGSEVYALVPAIREPPASTWVVDPDGEEADRPPTGRSLFDLIFVKQTDQGPVYDLPFPFTRLLERIEAPLRGADVREPILKKALIPFGRSLQRHAAAPEYFKHPRMVVAVDTEPVIRDDGHTAIMLKDRLFLGYQEKAGVIEVISYNEHAARFEFQVVTDYKANTTPRVAYAERTICKSCHQNGAPLFSEAPWDETNTNTAVADALAEVQKVFYGLSVNRCCAESPAAIDNATDRANLFAAYQLLWREGCLEPGSRSVSVRCRGAAFTAMLQHRLSAYSHFDVEAPRFRDDFLALFMRNWRHRWPDGLNIPNPNIPNRKPLLSPRPTHVPAELDPLRNRAPLAVWQAQKVRDRRRMITGLAEFLPDHDVRRLDGHLFDRAVRGKAPRLRLMRTCAVTRQALLGGAELLVIRCQRDARSAHDEFELLADLVHDGESGLRGSLVRLQLAGGELFTNLDLPPTDVRGGRSSRRARLEVRERRQHAHVRRADGNAIAALEIEWPGGGARAARVTLEIIEDFAPVHAAVHRLAGDHRSMLASRQPFRGTRAMRELFAALGIPATPWCCDHLPPMPPLVVAGELADAIAAGPRGVGDPRIPPAFYSRCAACHGGDSRMPPGFMHGPPEQVAANLSQCADRIYVRLGMWRVERSARGKSPMPPVVGLAAAQSDWPGGDEYRRILDYVSDLLVARGGTLPDLDALNAHGYDDLPLCLPTVGRQAARRLR